jgi:hypothetical protein
METSVDCVAPEWMFRFTTAYAPAPKDIADVQALAEKYYTGPKKLDHPLSNIEEGEVMK